jgi:outer membrane protein OmpA-like peptidoglycan-associated protein
MSLVRNWRSTSLAMFGLLVPLAGCQQSPSLMMSQPAAVQVTPAPSSAASIYVDRRILLTVHFGFDAFSIRPDSIPTLNNLSVALNDQRLHGLSYEINGHTDLGGNFAHNIALSAMRAKSVSDFLRHSGVQVPPIKAQGFGPLQLLYPSEPFNTGNRRVKIVALGP